MSLGVNSCELVNGTEGISDIEGKAATGSGERAGEASEFQICVSRFCERNQAENFLHYLIEGADGRPIE